MAGTTNKSGLALNRRTLLQSAVVAAAAAGPLAQTAAAATTSADKLTARAVNFKPVMHDNKACAAKIKATIETAAGDDIDLIVFPEMALQGFQKCQACADRGRACDKHLATGELVDGALMRELAEVVKRHNMYAVVGYGERDAARPFLYNAAAVLGPEGLIGSTRKMGVGAGIKQAHGQSMFTSGDRITVYPTRYGPVGVGICYDIWMNGSIPHLMTLQGARIIAVPTATVGTTRSGDLEKMAFTRARENNVFVINANLVGGSFEGPVKGEPKYYSHSYIAGPKWPSMAQVLGSTDDPFGPVTAEIDLAEYDRWLALSDQIARRRSGGADAHFSQAIAAGYAALIGKQVV